MESPRRIFWGFCAPHLPLRGNVRSAVTMTVDPAICCIVMISLPNWIILFSALFNWPIEDWWPSFSSLTLPQALTLAAWVAEPDFHNGRMVDMLLNELDISAYRIQVVPLLLMAALSLSVWWAKMKNLLCLTILPFLMGIFSWQVQRMVPLFFPGFLLASAWICLSLYLLS